MDNAEKAALALETEEPAVTFAPTWTGMLPAYLALIENGTAEGRAYAERELRRMARRADGVAHDRDREAATVRRPFGFRKR